MSVFEVILVRIFPHSDWIRKNTGSALSSYLLARNTYKHKLPHIFKILHEVGYDRSKAEIKDEKKKEFLYQTLQNISGIKLKLETQCEENWGNFKHLTSRRDAEGYTNNSKAIK